MPNIDESDIDRIMAARDLVPTRYRNRAEQVAGTWQFRDWAVAPTSRELLVHGEQQRRLDGKNGASALSIFCATLMRALRRRVRYVAVVFFCGRHAEEDDAFAGGAALVRSLTAQLLRYHYFDTALLHREVDLERVRAGDAAQLCALFAWLVRRLPQDVTLICLLDGIENYENDEYEADMLAALRCVLALVRDERLAPAVKILVTSSSGTEKVQEAFREDDACFLSMMELPRANQESSMLRLEGRLDDDSGNSDADGDDDDDDDDDDGDEEVD